MSNRRKIAYGERVIQRHIELLCQAPKNIEGSIPQTSKMDIVLTARTHHHNPQTPPWDTPTNQSEGLDQPL